MKVHLQSLRVICATDQVPELDTSSTPKPDFSSFLAKVQRGQAVIGKGKAVPTIIGKLQYMYSCRMAHVLRQNKIEITA